jgi:putative addiction module component (TIGR02574 family)
LLLAFWNAGLGIPPLGFIPSAPVAPVADRLSKEATMSETARVRNPPIDLKALTTDQKLDLIERLWNSMDCGQAPLSRAQHRELERRIAAYERTRDPGVPWPVVRNRILKRKR